MTPARTPKASSTDSDNAETGGEDETADMSMANDVHRTRMMIEAAFAKGIRTPESKEAAEILTAAKDIIGEFAGVIAAKGLDEKAKKTSNYSDILQKTRNLIIKSLSFIEENHKEKTGPDTDISPVDQNGLKHNKDTARRNLDSALAAIRECPDLAKDLETHELFSVLAAMKEAEEDPVAAEIKREVKIMWADRKKPEYKDQPWAKNASTYVTHMLAKWYEAGVLERKHLSLIPDLYKAYSVFISKNPDKDLGLKAAPRTNISDPAKAMEHRRAYMRKNRHRYA